MVRIMAFSNPRAAQAFIDYMTTQGIKLEMRPQGQEVELWLNEESRLGEVEQHLAAFLREPFHPRYQEASWRAGQSNHTLTYPRYSYLARIRSQAGPLTLSVMVLSILIYLLMPVVGGDRLMNWLGWPADSSQYWQLWRWVSHALLHFSPLHILFNLLWWWYLAGPLEKRFGSGKLATIALVSAFFSGWAQSLYSGIYFGGLSGVVYALMGYVWLTGELAPKAGIALPRGLMVFSLVWLVAGYFDIFGLAIANAAHVAGLILGLMMALKDVRSLRGPR